jgi:hypothetical protein
MEGREVKEERSKREIKKKKGEEKSFKEFLMK